MLDFKQFCILTEEWKTIASGGLKGMWKNPTKKEYQDIPAGVRAIVDHLGNVYISDAKIRYDQGSGFSDNHYELTTNAGKIWNKMKNFEIGSHSGKYNKSISLVRVGKRPLFKIGGDEWAQVGYITDEKPSHKLNKQRKDLLKKASKRNPAFSFQYKPISEEDDRWTM